MITVMLCFARSGGTVLNQCLGCLPDVVIMSEVNPLGGGWGIEGKDSFTTIKAQAKEWYGIDLESDEDDFEGSAVELSGKCKHLILRDWTVSNFFPNLGMNLIDGKVAFPAPNSFLILDALKDKCELKPFAFVRNSIDVYLSKGGSLPIFATAYLNYVREILRLEISVVRYEDFCRDPDLVIRDICNYTGLPYAAVTEKYMSFNTVNGDIQYNSRGQAQGQIVILPRIKVHESIMNGIDSCWELKEANRLLGYSVDFEKE